ncbi:MAG: hypothetical protein QNJ47_09715 [Nostocaceae cyanobacterium]|nr:hypothetical protein [Nostocaceae cyanobacterium]
MTENILAKKTQNLTEEQPLLANWWQKIVALITLANLILVLFNFSYISLRDVYLKNVPGIVNFYDPIKSIEPHPDTQLYLHTVDDLRQKLATTEIDTIQTKELFSQLRQQSYDLLNENPFLIANKLGVFAKIKRRMEYHTNTQSATKAFNKFWSPEFFTQESWQEELYFFDKKIRPLLEVNYFRNIDENGNFVDNFWQIDIYFIFFFAIEYLGRTFWIARYKLEMSWWDVILRNWYDGLLLLPTYRWLRIIPVAVRLHKSGLINLERILAQVTHEPSAYLADKVSMFLMVRLINQTQTAIETGEATRSLLKPQEYIQVSKINKIDAITDKILQLAIYKVLPQIQPDVEQILQHSLKATLKQSEFYQGLKQLPGMEIFPGDFTEQLADYIAETTYEILANSYADTQGRELFATLTQNFQEKLRQELQDEAIQAELQPLLYDLLEELKINYVQRSQKDDSDATLTEANQIIQEANEK